MDTPIVIAIIASVTAVFTVFITATLGFLTWSRNIKFQILKEERERLEKKYEIALELLASGLTDGKIHGRLAAMCHHEFPENVRSELAVSNPKCNTLMFNCGP